MTKVSQTIPKQQVAIIQEALSLLESTLKPFSDGDNQELAFKHFDALTLKAMLNQSELVINMPKEVYDNFTALNGIDFPMYIEDLKK